MSTYLKPVYLLADSQPLFKKYSDQYLLDSALDEINDVTLVASYIGASNDDHPDYFEIFRSAMQLYHIHDCRMIYSSFDENDRSNIEKSHIILLSGGDTAKGWQKIKAAGIDHLIRNAYLNGTIIIGVSAGAVQLGLMGLDTNVNPNLEYDTLRLVPFIIGAHEEKENWKQLKKLLQSQGENFPAIGLPSGSAVVYLSDHKIRPLGICEEFSLQDGEIRHNLLLPD